MASRAVRLVVLALAMTSLAHTEEVAAQRRGGGAVRPSGTASAQLTRLLTNITLTKAQRRAADSIVTWADAEQAKALGSVADDDGTGRMAIKSTTIRQTNAVTQQWRSSVRALLSPAQQKTWDANVQAERPPRRGRGG